MLLGLWWPKFSNIVLSKLALPVKARKPVNDPVEFQSNFPWDKNTSSVSKQGWGGGGTRHCTSLL